MRVATALAIGFVAGLAAAATAEKHANGGVFIMGVDGMDPVILSRLMDEGKMPNFQRLAREGSYQKLGTSNPPQSPVAWSNFVTGMNPGGHGIFDFLHRDPTNYHPVSSATTPGENPSAIHLFGYVIPLSGSDAKNNRGGTPWWDVLTEHGVDVEVFRIPGNFPTPESEAKVLSGMGTVDLRGGFGTYTLYTDTLVEKQKPKGDIEYVTVHDLDLDRIPDTVTSVLRGAPDQFHLEPGQVPSTRDLLAVGLTVHIDPDTETAVIEVGGNHVLVAEGEWSDWIEVTYELLPLGSMPVSGSVRFYAQQLRPRFQLYASPVNISPANPIMPLTSPDDFVEEIQDEIGFFYTQGMPEEQDALKDGVIDDDEYLRQVALVQEDTRRMAELALDRFEAGDATFVYFSDLDLQSHMLWRHGDPKYASSPQHPAFDAAVAATHAPDLENFYRDVDRALGDIRERLPAETLLIVMSDHGFQPFTRKFHLNAWLRDAGYLVMKDGKRTGNILLGDVDWSQTRAYGVGFNGLYLNREGREAEGIVTPEAADALMGEIAAKLSAVEDGGKRVVLRIDRGSEIYSGPRVAEGPDLVVGYDVGYGGSDETALGQIDETVLEDNTSRWSGSHLMAPEVVPGVLLMNRKLPSGSGGYDLTDVTTTLLSLYGLEKLPGMTGEPIF